MEDMVGFIPNWFIFRGKQPKTKVSWSVEIGNPKTVSGVHPNDPKGLLHHNPVRVRLNGNK
jgi:hypothetical protein